MTNCGDPVYIKEPLTDKHCSNEPDNKACCTASEPIIRRELFVNRIAKENPHTCFNDRSRQPKDKVHKNKEDKSSNKKLKAFINTATPCIQYQHNQQEKYL